MGKNKENSDPRPNSLVTVQRKAVLGPRKVRAPLTVKEKLTVIELLNSGVSQRAIGAELGISKTQVQHIHKSKDDILASVDRGELQLSAKVTVNLSQNKELDEAVYKWFSEMRNPKFRCKPLSISRAHIQARALREAEIRGLQDFKASDGWFRNWRKRFGVGASIRLCGEAGDVDVASIERPMAELRTSLKQFDPKNIFNMDETGLFYRAMPARTYLASNENRRTVRGTKALKAKDRITLVLCVNTDGIRT